MIRKTQNEMNEQNVEAAINQIDALLDALEEMSGPLQHHLIHGLAHSLAHHAAVCVIEEAVTTFAQFEDLGEEQRAFITAVSQQLEKLNGRPVHGEYHGGERLTN